MHLRKFLPLLLLAVGFGISGSGCPPVNPAPDPARVPAMKSFGSAEELRAYLAQQAKHRINATPFFGLASQGLGCASPAEPAVDGRDTLAGSPLPAEGLFSTTNVQEAGVDESDVVKNDGETIYVLEDFNVHVVDARPPAGLAELATVKLPAPGDSLYLWNGKLIALCGSYGWAMPGVPGWAESGGPMSWARAAGTADPAAAADIETPWPQGGQTAVVVIDVTDPARPEIEHKLWFQGLLVTSRMIDGRLHLVLSAEPRLPSPATPEAIDRIPLGEWIPDYRHVGPDGVVASGDVADWPSFMAPVYPDGFAITLAVTVHLDDPAAPVTTTAISAAAGTVYASTEALYITDTKFDWLAGGSHADTIIHKLAFTDSGTDYVASGMVPGRPLNQYSLGEHEGHLRIATMIDEFGWQAEERTGLYVLGVNGTGLEIVGRIEDLGIGERLYAARFIGPRGFLVTFKRIDPLFTVDLSDPANPRVAGELKVPGYSDHLQLLDENHLLAIGKDAQDNGSWAWVQGVKLSIYDVSDMTSPRVHQVNGRPAEVIIGGRGTHSEANSQPKALNHFRPLNALALPIDLWEGDTTGAEFGTRSFTGLYVYRVTVEGGFEFLTRIPTSPGLDDDGCYVGYYGPTRGVFIDNAVYAVTQRGVKAAPLDGLEVVGDITFAEAPPLWPDCPWWFEPQVVLPEGTGLR